MHYNALNNVEVAIIAESDSRFNKDALFTEMAIRLREHPNRDLRNPPELNRRDGDVQSATVAV